MGRRDSWVIRVCHEDSPRGDAGWWSDSDLLDVIEEEVELEEKALNGSYCAPTIRKFIAAFLFPDSLILYQAMSSKCKWFIFL